MNSLTGNLTSDAEALKKLLPAQDILLFPFETEAGMPFIAVYADGITDKAALGELVILPLTRRPAPAHMGRRKGARAFARRRHIIFTADFLTQSAKKARFFSPLSAVFRCKD